MSYLIYITIDIRWVIGNVGWCVNKKISFFEETSTDTEKGVS